MKRNFISLFSIITGVILLSTCTSAPEHQKPGGRSGVVFMDKKMFIEYLEENGLTTEQFVITIDGSNQEACFTKEKYVYFECVVYMGEDDVKSTCQSPYITEDRYFLVYEDMRVEVNYRDVRLYVKPAYEKFYDKSNAEDAPEFIRDIVVNESGQALAAEYGLKKGGIYYCLLHYDRYYVDSEDGPVKKTNAVLWISDSEFSDNKPQVELTPEYQGWTY